jgi:chemotaxis signal transduction protein
MLSGADDAPWPGGARALLLFEAGGTLYAVDATTVEIVVTRRPITAVPFAPGVLLGVASVAGRMRLVLDPSGGGAPPGELSDLIVLHGDAQLAIAAGRALGVRAVDPCAVDPAEDAPGVVGRASVEGRAALILDADRLIGIGAAR